MRHVPDLPPRIALLKLVLTLIEHRQVTRHSFLSASMLRRPTWCRPTERKRANLAREYVTHFAGVAGDDGIGAGMSSTVTADSNQRDAVVRPLRAELVGGKFSGKPRQ